MYNNFDDVHIATVYSPVIMKLSSGIVAFYLFYDRHVDVKIYYFFKIFSSSTPRHRSDKVSIK